MLWLAYTDAGQPFWKAVGWVLLNTHSIPVDTHFIGPSLSGGTTVDVVGGYEWLYLVPAVACLLGGAATVVLSANSSPIELAVGSYLAVGYAGTAVLSASIFEINTSKAGVGMMMRLSTWNMTWLIAIVGYPLVFGTLGAFIAQSPLLQDIQFRRLNRDG
ncbi:hypothetical protein DMJ13_18210 [halophilic archaeon]|nr:hypothetical protein DMJ13_18210 [halophilic archaeon]